MKAYMDNAATTAISPAALNAMTETMLAFPGNPSSLYSLGRAASKKLEEARTAVADAIGATPREIIFTSGGTESDNTALRSMAYRGAKKRKKAHYFICIRASRNTAHSRTAGKGGL